MHKTAVQIVEEYMEKQAGLSDDKLMALKVFGYGARSPLVGAAVGTAGGAGLGALYSKIKDKDSDLSDEEKKLNQRDRMELGAILGGTAGSLGGQLHGMHNAERYINRLERELRYRQGVRGIGLSEAGFARAEKDLLRKTPKWAKKMENLVRGKTACEIVEEYMEKQAKVVEEENPSAKIPRNRYKGMDTPATVLKRQLAYGVGGAGAGALLGAATGSRGAAGFGALGGASLGGAASTIHQAIRDLRVLKERYGGDTEAYNKAIWLGTQAGDLVHRKNIKNSKN